MEFLQSTNQTLAKKPTSWVKSPLGGTPHNEHRTERNEKRSKHKQKNTAIWHAEFLPKIQQNTKKSQTNCHGVSPHAEELRKNKKTKHNPGPYPYLRHGCPSGTEKGL